MTRSVRTHVMTDIRGYSRIILDGGTAEAEKIMRVYERLVRRALPRTSNEIDHIADSFHLAFSSPSQAVRTAVVIAESLQAHNDRHRGRRVAVAFGVDTSEGLTRGAHVLGSAPVLATHLCHRAEPGQILVSEAVFALLRTSSVPLRDVGVFQPAGSHAVHVYEARPPDPRDDGTASRERFLTALLFTDMVRSTATSLEMGNRRWAQVLEQHHALIRDELRRHGGMEVDTSGDGFYAAFGAPSRAIECGVAIRDRVRTLGIDVRVGVHAGECEVVAGKIGGTAVAICARVMSQGGAGDVLVSQTVRDLLAGTTFRFEEHSRRVLKGAPGEWTLYRVS